jgi:hypothetical protein
MSASSTVSIVREEASAGYVATVLDSIEGIG